MPRGWHWRWWQRQHAARGIGADMMEILTARLQQREGGQHRNGSLNGNDGNGTALN